MTYGVGCRAVELLLQAEAHGAVAPAVDPADRPKVRMVAQVVVGHEDDTGAAVGHLAAVEAAQPAFDDGVDLVVTVAAGSQVRHGPATCLRVGVRPRVGEVQLGDRAQVDLVEAVATVVLVGDLGEHVGPHELGVGALVSDPCRSAEVVGGGVARHGLLQLDADHQRGLVGAGAQIGDRCQRRDAARRARGLVA